MNKFQCKRCGKFFKQKVSLIYHLSNVNCNPVLSNVKASELLEQVKKPNYYKLYVKPKDKINVSEIVERLAILEQRCEDIKKRCCIHPLEIGDVKSVHSMLEDLVFNVEFVTGLEYVLKVFTKNYVTDNSPFYVTDCQSSYIHVLWKKTIMIWDKELFKKFMRRFLFPKLRDCCSAFNSWYVDHYDCEGHDTYLWNEVLRSLSNNNFKRYHKKIFSENPNLTESDEEETVNND